MCFSRRIGASPSMWKRVRLARLRMRAVPTMIRSPGLSSTFRVMAPHPPLTNGRRRSPEQPQDGLIGLRRERERRLRELLARVEGEEVCALLVLVGEDEAVGP